MHFSDKKLYLWGMLYKSSLVQGPFKAPRRKHAMCDVKDCLQTSKSTVSEAQAGSSVDTTQIDKWKKMLVNISHTVS
jgi:hypothetical protein